LLTDYFITNMVWFVIVCTCQCTSHYWVPLHVRHQHYWDPLGFKAEIYSGRQYLTDGSNILVSCAGQSSNYGFWPSSITSSHSTLVGKFKLIFHHSTTWRFQAVQLDKLEKSFMVYRPLPRPFIPII